MRSSQPGGRPARAGIGLLVAFALALVPTGLTTVAGPDTGAAASGSTLSQRAVARAEAAAALATTLAPPGGRAVDALRSSRLRQPAASAVCTPLIRVTRRWVVPHTTMRAIADHLATHPSPGMREYGTGRAYREPATGDPMPLPPTEVGRTLSRDVTERARTGGLHGATLIYTIAPEPSGAIGVRADVEVVPRGAECTRS
jgi:hypothetical protein